MEQQSTLPTAGIAAVYARIDQMQETSELNQQIDQCKRFCEQRGYAMSQDHVYIDIGSGATLDRPGFKRIIDAARRGDFTIVVVTTLDRIASDAVMRHTMVLGLEVFLGVKVLSADKTKLAS